MDGGAGFPFTGRNSVKVRLAGNAHEDAGHVTGIFMACTWC